MVLQILLNKALLPNPVYQPSLTAPARSCQWVEQWPGQARTMPAWYLHPKSSAAIQKHQQFCSHSRLVITVCSDAVVTMDEVVLLLLGLFTNSEYQRLCSHSRLILRLGTDAVVAGGRGGSQGHQVQLLLRCNRLRSQACLGPAGSRCASHQPGEEEANVLPHPEAHGCSGAGPSQPCSAAVF